MEISAFNLSVLKGNCQFVQVKEQILIRTRMCTESKFGFLAKLTLDFIF